MEKPSLYLIRQGLESSAIDAGKALAEELEKFNTWPFEGKNIAIGAGSRGITGIGGITRQVVDFIRSRGGRPFIFPCMGSHGGATAAGQVRILAGLNITEQSMGCPVRSSMEVREIRKTDDGQVVYFDRNAWDADGIVLINRIKPHTDFHGKYESGLVKMAVIGAGKKTQAAAIHGMGPAGFRDRMPVMARQIFSSGRIIGGIAIVEDACKQTMLVRALTAPEILDEEPGLLETARSRMPRLPVTKSDILVVDRLGKDISGVGMDPAIIGRKLIPGEEETSDIGITRIMIDDLTEASHGNALGIGLGDVITRKLFDKIDFNAMYENILTSTLYERARIPIIARNAADAMRFASRGCPELVAGKERIMRIRDTLHLDRVFVSNAILEEIGDKAEVIAGPLPQFTEKGELADWPE